CGPGGPPHEAFDGSLDAAGKSARATLASTVGRGSTWHTLSSVPGPDSCGPLLERGLEGVDVVLHAAGAIHVRRTADWYRVNTAATLALGSAARQVGVRRFVFISSNAAGGASPSSDRLLTEDDPARPLSHYGRSKWLAEQGLLRLHDPPRFEVVILRP